MSKIKTIEQRYIDQTYLRDNPTWDNEDAPWKAKHIYNILQRVNAEPKSICDIGCGTGGILFELNKKYPNTEFSGYDISPNLEEFWKKYREYGIEFHQGKLDLSQLPIFDVVLVIDVLEHLADPFTFLQSIQGKAKYYVFHIPLDLSALSVLREKPLVNVRGKVGHVHYYTKTLALMMLEEAGFNVNSWHYTSAYKTVPVKNIKTKLAMIPRQLFQSINKDLAVRVLGGETLMVLASL